MKNINDQNVCIRIDRDEAQIDRCVNRLQSLDNDLSDMAQILALAGNGVRLKMLYTFWREKRLCVCDLGEILQMKLPAVSQHLRKMKDAGLLFTEREGTTIFYYLNPERNSILSILFTKLSMEEMTV